MYYSLVYMYYTVGILKTQALIGAIVCNRQIAVPPIIPASIGVFRSTGWPTCIVVGVIGGLLAVI
jgi:hypothetical protein